MPDDDSKPRKTGCAILFVPTLIVISFRCGSGANEFREAGID